MRLALPICPSTASWLGLLLVMVGCRERLSPESFLSEYTKRALVELEAGEYRLSLMHASREYLAAREYDSTWSSARLDSVLSSFGKGHHLHLAIRPKTLQVLSEPSEYSPAPGIPVLSASQVYLQAKDGRKILPQAFFQQRNRGAAFQASYLLWFPSSAEGKAVDLESCRLMVEDLSAGRIPLDIKFVPNLEWVAYGNVAS